MKLIIREYLASLREREELDAILPDLLSELGFTVYSRPSRGTTQYGVDVAAVGAIDGDERRLYLFTIKRGDLTRADWDGTPQALRSSLNEIQDVYVVSHIPPELADLNITICLCFGGDVHETVRANLTSYTTAHTNDRIRFEEWNGDKISGLLLNGVLREDLLPKTLRANFQKAVALLDEPEAAYSHFARLAEQIHKNAGKETKARTRAARQLYICLWILFVWARDIENVEGPYQASELAILCIWELCKPSLGEKGRGHAELLQVLLQCVQLHLTIASELLEKKVGPHAKTQDGLAMAVWSRSWVDINLKLFDTLGRVAMCGLWLEYFSTMHQDAGKTAMKEGVTKFCEIGMSMVESNSALLLPVRDDQATSIALFLMLCIRSQVDANRPLRWLEAMVHRYEFSVATLDRYPVCFKDYRRLIDRPVEDPKEHFKEATAGSTLNPILAAWLTGFGRVDLLARLSEMAKESFGHCNMQLWTPDTTSENHLYLNSEEHGVAICDLPIPPDGSDLLKTINEACEHEKAVEELSAVKTGFWPIVLLACRHWRHPIPPWFWIRPLVDAVEHS